LATGAAITGAGVLAFAAGVSSNLVGVAGVLVVGWLLVGLQQHLHSQRLSSQPIKPPSRSQNQQQDKALKNELIFTPQ
jgi:hypothetical protein